MLLWIGDDDHLRRGLAIIGASVLGLLDLVLHGFLLRADFITKDRTTLSGSALTPPLLESMNMKEVGRFSFFLGGDTLSPPTT
jgi:hypothetical protein